MDQSFVALKYGVGIDMGKDSFYACISAIDQAQRIKIKATHCFSNTPKGVLEFHRWTEYHYKEKSLPLHYLMEATGVYYEQLALSLHQRGAHVVVVLPQKAKHYVKALGIKTKTDSTFGGQFKARLEDYYDMKVVISRTPISDQVADSKVVIHKWRWVVERTFSWFGNNRRLAKDYERTTTSAESFLWIAHIRRTIRWAGR